ncbi:hypothetical protein GQX74_006632 [Glossina fuscipes]|nr:hypothetical protein GQX74_006632 [Glossina fuscipes]
MYLLQSCPEFWQPLSWQQNPQNSQLQENRRNESLYAVAVVCKNRRTVGGGSAPSVESIFSVIIIETFKPENESHHSQHSGVKHKEFRLILRQDPLSVFANDVRIETTEGPMDYDISRVYTGSLEVICNCIHEEAGPYTRLGFYWPDGAKIYWIDMQIV